MHPILFQLGPFTLYTYGLLVALGFGVAAWWLTARAQKAGEDPDVYLQAVIWAMVCGFIGARLWYVLYDPAPYFQNPLRLLTDRGGLVWYGGMIAAIAGLTGFAWRKKIPLAAFLIAWPPRLRWAWPSGALAAFSLGAATASPARCLGPYTSRLGHVTYPAAVHPTQLYESAALAVITAALLWVARSQPRHGTMGALFLLLYGVARFVIEALRGDGILWWMGLTASQTISLYCVLVSLAWLVVLLRRTPDGVSLEDADRMEPPVLEIS